MTRKDKVMEMVTVFVVEIWDTLVQPALFREHVCHRCNVYL